MRAPGSAAETRPTNARICSCGDRTRPTPSTRQSFSPTASMSAPTSAPLDRTSRARCAVWASSSSRVSTARSSSITRVGRQDVAAQTAEDLGPGHRGRPVARSRRRAWGPCALMSAASTESRTAPDVELPAAGRERELADVELEGAPQVVPVVGPLEPALGRRVEVEAALVEELDLHRGGVRGRGTHREAAQRAGGPRVEARDGDGHQLEVVAVDPGRVGAGHHGPLHDAGRPRRVPAGGDDRPLGQETSVGNGQAKGHLGSDVDVHDAGDPPLAEEVPGAPRLPDDRLGDDRTGVDHLEGVDLHVRVDERPLAHVALVGDDDAFLEPRTCLDVGVLAEHAAPKARVRPRYAPSWTMLRCRVAPELTMTLRPSTVWSQYLGAGLDPAVLPDVGRTHNVSIRAELGAGAEPDAVAHLEAFDLDLHLTVEHLPVSLEGRPRGCRRLSSAGRSRIRTPAGPCPAAAGTGPGRSRTPAPAGMWSGPHAPPRRCPC